MKVLLDEMLPIGLRELLTEHDVVTAGYAGLAGIPNGQMIEGAIAADFDVILTLDRGIQHQQNLDRYPIGFVLIDDNEVDLIKPYADQLSDAIANAHPGGVARLGHADRGGE